MRIPSHVMGTIVVIYTVTLEILTLGDPTEVALVVAANNCGLDNGDVETTFPRVADVPFESDRKRMITIHNNCGIGSLTSLPPSAYIAFTKGAVGW